MEKQKRKRSNIIIKILSLIVIAVVIVSVLVIPCYASYITSGYIYSLGVPITVEIGGVSGEYTTYKYLINGYNEVYTNGGNVSAMLDDSYITNSYNFPSGMQFIDHKVISLIDDSFSGNRGEYIAYDYEIYSNTMGDQEILARQYAYVEGWDQSRLVSELRTAYENYDFYETSVSHINVPKYNVEIPLDYNTMGFDYLPTTFYYTFYGLYSPYNSILDGISPRFTCSFYFTQTDIEGELVTTEYIFRNVPLNSRYYRVINHHYNPSGDPVNPNNVPYRTTEDFIANRVASAVYGLTLYSLEFDFKGIEDYIKEQLEYSSTLGVINDLSFYVDFDIHDENGFYLPVLNDIDILDYYNHYRSIPCYSFGTVNDRVFVTDPYFPDIVGTKNLVNAHVQKYSHYTEYEIVELREFNLVSWLGDTLGGIFDIELIGTITLSQILYVTIGLGLVIVFLKVFSGG